MQEDFSLTSFILGQSEVSEDFFDNLDIKKERDFYPEEYKGDTTTANMPVPDFNPPLYSYCAYNAQGGNVASPVSLPSPMIELSPADSPAHIVPTSDDYGRRGLRYALHSSRAQGYATLSRPQGRRRKRDEELTFEEYEKRRLRRERNKEAALRCRTRRRERIEALEKETAELEGMNSDAEKEISNLRAQLEELQNMLAEHQCHMGVDDFAFSTTSVKQEPEF